ncbi:hypothetical protein [Acinetobacter baumannii]|uniref:hypothetical protein n=1 Tax=Acinetobacter baumannii TaxID=470 RepID=UPI00034DB521|nr:hypothetical protein [Acinetobacter baumannii]RCU28221.1 hypothetical protein DVA79_14030 [Acinetobacter baumannii]RCU30261.1 hypothetical protein DVA69_16325 [Acinetobacter baumannii]RCU36283.1 hypothetical protein DVA81_11650 [Acinetobacter baumannii]
MTQIEQVQAATELLKALNPAFIAIFLLGAVVGTFFFSGLFRFFDNLMGFLERRAERKLEKEK